MTKMIRERAEEMVSLSRNLYGPRALESLRRQLEYILLPDHLDRQTGLPSENLISKTDFEALKHAVSLLEAVS